MTETVFCVDDVDGDTAKPRNRVPRYIYVLEI